MIVGNETQTRLYGLNKIFKYLTSASPKERMLAFVIFNESPIGRTVILAANNLLFYPPSNASELIPVRLSIAYLMTIVASPDGGRMHEDLWKTLMNCWEETFKIVGSDLIGLTKEKAIKLVRSIFDLFWITYQKCQQGFDLGEVAVLIEVLNNAIINTLTNAENSIELLTIMKQHRRGGGYPEMRDHKNSPPTLPILEQDYLIPAMKFDNNSRGWTDKEYEMYYLGIREHCKEKAVSPPHGYTKFWGDISHQLLQASSSKS